MVSVMFVLSAAKHLLKKQSCFLGGYTGAAVRFSQNLSSSGIQISEGCSSNVDHCFPCASPGTWVAILLLWRLKCFQAESG